MDFVPDCVRQLYFDFNLDLPPLLAETREALKKFIIERDSSEKS